MDVTRTIKVLKLSEDLTNIQWQASHVGENIDIDDWSIPGESVIGWGGTFMVVPGPNRYTLEGSVESYDLHSRSILLNLSPISFEHIFLTGDTTIFLHGGTQLDVSSFDPSSDTRMEIQCRPILRGCMAINIQILE